MSHGTQPPADADEPEPLLPSDAADWHYDRGLLAVLAVYAVLTLLGVAVATGALVPDTWFEVASKAPATQVPPFVFLYAFLGASTFAFSNLLRKENREWRDLVRLGMRVLSALPLAAGVYLLGSFLGGGADVAGGRAAAGLAFLTGLYVNLALEALYGLGMRLYGLRPSEADQENEENEVPRQPEPDPEEGGEADETSRADDG
ncbi:MAG: hypothetical protein ACI9YT_002673 [Halobacteriales archaeon]|jgi:hypothetical protein